MIKVALSRQNMYIHDVGSKVKHHNPGSQCMKGLAKWFILRVQISLQGSIMPMIVTNVEDEFQPIQTRFTGIYCTWTSQLNVV